MNLITYFEEELLFEGLSWILKLINQYESSTKYLTFKGVGSVSHFIAK